MRGTESGPNMETRQNGHRQRPPHQQQNQRFSWQAPPNEEAPPYQPPQQQPSGRGADPNSRERVFSYTQTPIEHQDPYYSTQSPVTPIDLRPQSFYPPIDLAVQRQQQNLSQQPNAYSTTTANSLAPPQQESHPAPAHDVHRTEVQNADTRTQPNNHARKLSNLAPINTALAQRPMPPPLPPIPSAHRPEADPLPSKSPISAGHTSNPSTNPTPISPRRKSLAGTAYSGPVGITNEPYSPHNFSKTPTHAVFSPHSSHGPNGLDAALHKPGQISHPNMQFSSTTGASTKSSWKYGLLSCSCSAADDVSTCLTGLFCPCIIYGRTAHRLTQKTDKKDPTDMLGYSATNGQCALMSLACGLWCLFPTIQRTRIRHSYKLEGSVGGDVARGCCCCCCVVVQNEREVRENEEKTRRWAGPASVEVYGREVGMEYKAQR